MSHTLIASNPPSYDMWLAVAAMCKDGKEIRFINDSLISGHAEVTWIMEQIPLFPVYRESLSRPPLFSNPLYCVDMISKNNNCDLTRALHILWNEAHTYATEDVSPAVVLNEDEIADNKEVYNYSDLSFVMENMLDALTTYLRCSSVIINKQLVWSKGRQDHLYFISCQLENGGVISISGVHERVKEQLNAIIAEVDEIETRAAKFDGDIPF